ncbi:MAG TPA: WbqC family protein [Usitatibacter sp.]|nr:WbqC family protein [Usitatibacter sp.]
MSTVAVLQSNYVPWKGYFDIIHDVDTFVFYDDVQFTKNDWRNRNRIKTAQGVRWLSVPVGAHIGRTIREVAIPDARWQRKHYETLRQSYSKAPRFRDVEPFLEEVYLERAWDNLSALNRFLIERIARDFLGIATRFDDSSRYALAGTGQERLLAQLAAVGATTYVSGPSGRNYMDVAQFERRGIRVVFKDYSGYPEYPQLHPPFEHRVSILDLLFHAGRDAPRYIWGPP